MHWTKLPSQVRCPECGRSVRAETAAMLSADYWHHLEKEHGRNRSISVRHMGPER